VPARFTFGTVGRELPDVRNPGLAIFDLSILKRYPIHEARHLEYRAEFFNIANHVNFAAVPDANTVFGRAQFGTVTDAERARIIQMGLNSSGEFLAAHYARCYTWPKMEFRIRYCVALLSFLSGSLPDSQRPGSNLRKLNLILVTIDTLRADRLGC